MLKSYLAFDVETTGLSPESDEIIEIGALKVQDGKVCDRFITFVKPSEPVSERITEITGITNDPSIVRAVKFAQIVDVGIERTYMSKGTSGLTDSGMSSHSGFFN